MAVSGGLTGSTAICIPFVQPYKTLMLLFNSVVVNILQKDMFPQDVDTEIRRGCYAICLQLARFVFFGVL